MRVPMAGMELRSVRNAAVPINARYHLKKARRRPLGPPARRLLRAFPDTKPRRLLDG